MDKIHLRNLFLSWCVNRFEVNYVTESEVLEGLHPHYGFKQLHITGYGGVSSPTWLSSNLPLISLESIHLNKCTKWEVLPPLGQFPLLKTLHLIQLHASREVPIVFSDDWTGSEKQVLFPCLEELVIRDCLELRALPSLQFSSKDKGSHTFGCLRYATIYNCPQLMNLPQFGQMKALSTISIEGVGSFPHIRLLMRALYINGCASPRTLDEILLLIECRLSVLEKLTIESFLDLAYLPWEIFSKLVSLETLVIVDCPRLSLPSYLSNQDGGNCSFPPFLKKLVIRACSFTGKQLSHLLLQLPFLYCLTIGKCPKISSLAVGDLITGNVSSSISIKHHWTTDGLLQIPSDLVNRLQYLRIDDFPDLVLLCKVGFLGFNSLKTLHITGCPQLLSPMLTGKERSNDSCSLLPPSLEDLMVTHMHNKLLPFFLSNLTSLSTLAISRSPDLTSLGLHCCTSLETLIIEKCVFLSALEGLRSLAGLKYLRVFECPSLATLWDPSSADGQNQSQDLSLHLEKLEIDNTSFFSTEICKKLPCLQHVVFFMAKNVTSFTEEQEQALHHLTSIHVLDFCYCPDLLSLPKELHCLTSLRKLSIKACPGIQSLPENGLPASLQELYVSNCSAELKEQCRKTKNVRRVYVDRHASKFITICKLLRLYFRKRKR